MKMFKIYQRVAINKINVVNQNVQNMCSNLQSFPGNNGVYIISTKQLREMTNGKYKN